MLSCRYRRSHGAPGFQLCNCSVETIGHEMRDLPIPATLLEFVLLIGQVAAATLQFEEVRKAERTEEDDVRPSRIDAHALEFGGGRLCAVLAERDVGPSPARHQPPAQHVGDHALEMEFGGGRSLRRFPTCEQA